MVHLEHWGIKILRSSKIYETEPVGLKDQPWFYNIAVCAETVMTPEELLKAVKSVEKGMGRTVTERNGPRKIDIDILFYDDVTVEMDGLTIPHRRIAERNFVLIPMAELAPERVHPVLKKSIAEILKGCDDKSIVRPL
jgi:2-amino-4-hydroxy-6-hydroxymethyldihydropteridine diphosphokinase